jgi:hypothetical protein
MEVASCTSVDSGVDANSDVGSSEQMMSSSSDVHSSDTGEMLKEEIKGKADDQDMIMEDVTPSNIPMTL